MTSENPYELAELLVDDSCLFTILAIPTKGDPRFKLTVGPMDPKAPVTTLNLSLDGFKGLAEVVQAALARLEEKQAT